MASSEIEMFEAIEKLSDLIDPMLQAKYQGLNEEIFTIDKQADPIELIEDIAAYNEKEGLALSPEEVQYLEQGKQRFRPSLNRQ